MATVTVWLAGNITSLRRYSWRLRALCSRTSHCKRTYRVHVNMQRGGDREELGRGRNLTVQILLQNKRGYHRRSFVNMQLDPPETYANFVFPLFQ